MRSPSKIAEANLLGYEYDDADDGSGPIFLSSPSEAKSNDRTEQRRGGGREGDNIQNGFLMGGNHSPMIRMTLPRKRETMGDGEGSERTVAFFVPPSDTIGIFPRRQRR